METDQRAERAQNPASHQPAPSLGSASLPSQRGKEGKLPHLSRSRHVFGVEIPPPCGSADATPQNAEGQEGNDAFLAQCRKGRQNGPQDSKGKDREGQRTRKRKVSVLCAGEGSVTRNPADTW